MKDLHVLIEHTIDKLEEQISEFCVCGVHPETQAHIDALRETVRIFDGTAQQEEDVTSCP